MFKTFINNAKVNSFQSVLLLMINFIVLFLFFVTESLHEDHIILEQIVKAAIESNATDRPSRRDLLWPQTQREFLQTETFSDIAFPCVLYFISGFHKHIAV